jgi:VWFA-related protein
MLPAAALLGAALVLAQGQVPEELVVSIAVTDRRGHPIEDLKPEEVTVHEDGARLPVSRLEHDRRPMRVALVLDSSAALGSSFQADVVPAALSFVKRLPPDTAVSAWVTSDRPRQVLEATTDAKALQQALRQVAPLGENAAVDTIVAASQELAAVEGHRTAVVIVTSATMGSITTDVAAQLGRASFRPTFVAVELLGGQQDARVEDALKLLVNRTGGFHERVFSAMAVETQLRRISEYLASSYRVAWKPKVDPRGAKLDVKVSRKDTRTRMAQRLSTAW